MTAEGWVIVIGAIGLQLVNILAAVAAVLAVWKNDRKLVKQDVVLSSIEKNTNGGVAELTEKLRQANAKVAYLEQTGAQARK